MKKKNDHIVLTRAEYDRCVATDPVWMSKHLTKLTTNHESNGIIVAGNSEMIAKLQAIKNGLSSCPDCVCCD